ncbi:MAG: YicC family protein [Oligoflexus sp.]|jgi:uncharacterized protein (TIGR00255 family)|nr:YicC family protein [Pseudopedobacter sp.]
MIKSMTGYGTGIKNLPNGKYTVEIKSLNSKFLELNIKLPKAFSDKEFFLRNECSKLLERGKIMLSINVDTIDNTSKAATINKDLLKHYFTELQSAATELGQQSDDKLFIAAINLPEVIKYDESSVSEEEWKLVLEAFYASIDSFQKFRADEGAVLEKDLIERVQTILDLMGLVAKNETNRIPAIKEKLTFMLSNVVGKEKVDQNRLEQELIYYIDKLDITEEKVRLKSHCDYFIETLKNKDANGKKLGFISQEIGREINTMGSKANDASIQRYVVGMKEELEKIKEQLLNVL